MILESMLVVFTAIFLDFLFGDPKNRYHPTAWIGNLVAKITPYAKNKSERKEKTLGIFLVVFVATLVCSTIILLGLGLSAIKIEYLKIILSVMVGAVLLKFTIAIKGMEHHSFLILQSLESNNLDGAKTSLSMIVKRQTETLDKDHVISGVLESISENTVDGITGPLFYFSIFGLPGAFVYRTINTIDSMIGYKTYMFKNVGWFGANCDKILNYIPSRLTSLLMVFSACILKKNWRNSYHMINRDGKKTESPNAGFPMSALAGALDIKLEKVGCYSLGDSNTKISISHIREALQIMKVTSILFALLICTPIICFLSLMGWLFV